LPLLGDLGAVLPDLLLDAELPLPAQRQAQPFDELRVTERQHQDDS
jgi:hypothetical protein